MSIWHLLVRLLRGTPGQWGGGTEVHHALCHGHPFHHVADICSKHNPYVAAGVTAPSASGATLATCCQVLSIQVLALCTLVDTWCALPYTCAPAPQEVAAALALAEQGVLLVAGVAKIRLQAALRNPLLQPLLGGVETVTTTELKRDRQTKQTRRKVKVGLQLGQWGPVGMMQRVQAAHSVNCLHCMVQTAQLAHFFSPLLLLLVDTRCAHTGRGLQLSQWRWSCCPTTGDPARPPVVCKPQHTSFCQDYSMY